MIQFLGSNSACSHLKPVENSSLSEGKKKKSHEKNMKRCVDMWIFSEKLTECVVASERSGVPITERWEENSSDYKMSLCLPMVSELFMLI